MVSWRYLSSDPVRTVFNVYRDGLLVTPKPVAVSTQFYDYNPSRGKSVYEVRPVIDGCEKTSSGGKWTLPADAPCGYVDIPLQQPEPQTMPDGEVCTYTANDASVGDLDGDGDFEIVLKWSLPMPKTTPTAVLPEPCFWMRMNWTAPVCGVSIWGATSVRGRLHPVHGVRPRWRRTG